MLANRSWKLQYVNSCVLFLVFQVSVIRPLHFWCIGTLQSDTFSCWTTVARHIAKVTCLRHIWEWCTQVRLHRWVRERIAAYCGSNDKCWTLSFYQLNHRRASNHKNCASHFIADSSIFVPSLSWNDVNNNNNKTLISNNNSIQEGPKGIFFLKCLMYYVAHNDQLWICFLVLSLIVWVDNSVSDEAGDSCKFSIRVSDNIMWMFAKYFVSNSSLSKVKL